MCVDHVGRGCTHHHGPAGALAVHALVAQVQHERGRAVEEPQHPHGHKELGGGGVVALQVRAVGGRAVADGNVVGLKLEPEGNRGVGVSGAPAAGGHKHTGLTCVSCSPGRQEEEIQQLRLGLTLPRLRCTPPRDSTAPSLNPPSVDRVRPAAVVPEGVVEVSPDRLVRLPGAGDGEQGGPHVTAGGGEGEDGEDLKGERRGRGQQLGEEPRQTRVVDDRREQTQERAEPQAGLLPPPSPPPIAMVT